MLHHATDYTKAFASESAPREILSPKENTEREDTTGPPEPDPNVAKHGGSREHKITRKLGPNYYLLWPRKLDQRVSASRKNNTIDVCCENNCAREIR
jgi:hypothetical protein